MSRSYDSLGQETDPEKFKIWSGFEPIITIEGVDRPLFAFWRVPFANQIDKDSPLGVSVYSRAVKQLKEADMQWDRYLWEYKGGELAVHAGEEVLRKSLQLTVKKQTVLKCPKQENVCSENLPFPPMTKAKPFTTSIILPCVMKRMQGV